MSETDRNAAVRIHIDQQVFIDAIAGAEEIEDATVVTEVVGFDRSNEYYVLDGALVFTGYVRQMDEEDREITAEDLMGDIASAVAEDDVTVQQIHCRMPFTLEVPVAAQRTEYINVTARVGTWNLHVLGPKWVHVRAELIVNGLTGAEGYRFRCGTQEEGFANVEQGALEQPPSVPYLSPYATPSQPLTWDRPWSQSAYRNDAGSSTIGIPPSGFTGIPSGSISAFANSGTPHEEYQPAAQSGVEAFRYAEDVRSHSLPSDASSSKLQMQAANDSAVADSRSEQTRVEQIQPIEQIQAEQVQAQVEQIHATEAQELEYARGVESQTERREESFMQALETAAKTQELQTEAQAESATVFEIGHVHASASASASAAAQTYHFEELAESSTVQKDPQFQLKIQSKKEKESSTFDAMSKLMDAAKPASQSIFRESNSESRPGVAVPVTSGVVETPVVEEVSVIPVVEQVAAVSTPVAPTVLQQSVNLQETEAVEQAESKTVVDLSVAELPQASITIAEDKKYRPEEDRVYLWTEMYPYLEETFQTMKFRIVQETDTIDRIAENYRVLPSEVMRVNQLTTEQIDIGQLLYIPERKR